VRLSSAKLAYEDSVAPRAAMVTTLGEAIGQRADRTRVGAAAWTPKISSRS